MGTTGGKSNDEFAPIARAEYFKLYESTARALKSVDAAYRVGGPATAGSGWIDETLAYCAQKGLPLDFVSTHTYATISGYSMRAAMRDCLLGDREAITGEVKHVRSLMDNSKFSGSELHYTEWSSSYTPSDPIHDSYHSAAFILDKIRNIGSSANSMSYWTFTDIFEEAGPLNDSVPRWFWAAKLSGLAEAVILCLPVSKPSGRKGAKVHGSCRFCLPRSKGWGSGSFLGFHNHPSWSLNYPPGVLRTDHPALENVRSNCVFRIFPRVPIICTPTKSVIGRTMCRPLGATWGRHHS